MSALPPPLPLAEAQARLLAGIAPLPDEAVPTGDSLGRYLARPLLAARTQPAADLSAMDGYALREGETGPWRVIGESAAGHPFAGTVGPGEAVRISTGALMPDGANAVLLQEDATRDGGSLSLNGEGAPTPRHIRRAGFDFSAGQQVLGSGARIGPAQIALALSAGHSSLSLHRRPALHVIDSGDELAADPSNCPPDRIPASNGAMIAALAMPFVSKADLSGPVPDRLDLLIRALDAAERADVIVTSGGASVGDHDLIRPALEKWGADISFWRVAIRPGKPLLIARKGQTFVLGLPGNPVSSYVTAFLFLLPLLKVLAGCPTPLPQPIFLPLDGELPRGGARAEFRRARISEGSVAPIDELDSSALLALASADALIERPIDASPAPPGTLVPVYSLVNG